MVTRPSRHDYGVLMKEGFLLTVPSLGLDRVGLKGGRSELPDSSQRYKKYPLNHLALLRVTGSS